MITFDAGMQQIAMGLAVGLVVALFAALTRVRR